MNEELVSFTATTSTDKYDRTTQDFIDWVRNVPLESDAVYNLKICLKIYEKRMSLWKLLKLIFNK